MYSHIGYYKNITTHGFYESEYDRVKIKLNCNHIIQLFIRDTDKDKHIINLMAHEWRHYLQYTKPTLRRKYVEGNKRSELDARKYADKVENKWLEVNN